MTTVALPPWTDPIARLRAKLPPPVIMPSGHPARARLLQTVYWSAIVAACAAAFIAGLYYLGFEVHYPWGTLKGWWDGTYPYHGGMGNLFTSKSWPLYRHGERDNGESEWATLIVGTLIAGRKTWHWRAPLWYMVLSPVLVLVSSVAGIAGVVWILNFGIPHWLYPHTPGATLDHWWLLVGTLVAGFLLGRLIHPIWKPVGATINGWFIDWSVDKFLTKRARIRAAAGIIKPIVPAPFWVRHWWTAPLPLRERWMASLESQSGIYPTKYGRRDAHRSLPRWALRLLIPVGGLGTLLVVLIVLVGFIAHFWIGTGHSFPILAPA